MADRRRKQIEEIREKQDAVDEDKQAGETDPENKPFDAQEYIRQVVSDSIAPYTDRISALEAEVADLRAVVTQPAGAVQFLTDEPPTHPAVQRILGGEDDTPDYVRAEQTEDTDKTPWYH